MESDSLLSGRKDGPSGADDGHRRGHRCQLVSNWVLVAAVLFLSAVLIADIQVRVGERGRTESKASTANDSPATTPSSSLPSTPPAARFHATQFISFTINTLGGLAEHGECEGRSVDPNSNSCYLGDDDIESDVSHRLSILEEILFILRNDVFQEEPEVDRDPGTLKILMMPEFLLRGPRGAYSTSQMFDAEDDEEDGMLIKLSDAVRDLIFDDAFENFLFVFGTVIVAEPIGPNSHKKPWDADLVNANEVMYFNIAPVFRGGADKEGEKHHIILKQYISGADFLSRASLPNPTEFDKHAYAKLESSKVLKETFSKRNMTVVSDNYLEIDGIKFGFEICLDHR
ncbi:hypothetical protein ACHAWF_011545 [Thalassiosira exigua]